MTPTQEEVTIAQQTIVAGILKIPFRKPPTESWPTHVQTPHEDEPDQKKHPLVAELVITAQRHSSWSQTKFPAYELQDIHGAEHTLSAVVKQLSTDTTDAAAKELFNVSERLLVLALHLRMIAVWPRRCLIDKKPCLTLAGYRSSKEDSTRSSRQGDGVVASNEVRR